MKILLRSCFVVNAKQEQRDLLFRNVQTLRESNLGFDIEEDIVIWRYIQDFILAHNHVPDFTTILSHFERKREPQVVDRLRTLEVLSPITQGDFVNRVEEKAEDRRQRMLAEILKDASSITTVGLTLKDKKGKERILKGTRDAAQYMVEKTHAIVLPTFGSSLSGEITSDGDDFLKEYQKRAEDPNAGLGYFCGIEQIDRVMRGAKKKELWVHAGFTGAMKSTTAVNWVYNLAVWYKHSSLYFSLEMPYAQLRNILYSMHTFHPKFKELRFKLGLQANPNQDIGLDYEKIRDGTLSSEEFTLLREVVRDFNDISNGYGRIYIEVADPDRNTFTVADMRNRGELIYSKDPFVLMVVDHAGLVDPQEKHSSTTDRLNEVLRGLKKMAMSFNRGSGMAVLALFQINREGWKMAVKRKEKTGIAEYDLTALSYANECERSADVVTSSWMDNDLRDKGRVQYQCLKSRDTRGFDTFIARVEWPCRRVLTTHESIQDIGAANQEEAKKIQKALEAL